MTSLLLTYLFYISVGIFEWFLAMSRTIFTIRRNKIIVPLTVFIENFVGLLVFRNFIVNDDWIIALVYSLGGALGSLLPLYLIKQKCKKNEEPVI